MEGELTALCSLLLPHIQAASWLSEVHILSNLRALHINYSENLQFLSCLKTDVELCDFCMKVITLFV